jgi:hypothetical protein
MFDTSVKWTGGIAIGVIRHRTGMVAGVASRPYRRAMTICLHLIAGH